MGSRSRKLPSRGTTDLLAACRVGACAAQVRFANADRPTACMAIVLRAFYARRHIPVNRPDRRPLSNGSARPTIASSAQRRRCPLQLDDRRNVALIDFLVRNVPCDNNSRKQFKCHRRVSGTIVINRGNVSP